MKKLMIATAALCAAVSVGALESANVVGYDQTGLRFGSKGAGASFVPVSSATTIDLQDITAVGYNTVDGSDGDVTAQVLDNAGRDIATYSWVDVNDGEDVFYGWYDDNGALAEGVTFAPGDGLYVRAPDTTYSLRSAGQVPTTDISVQLRFGSKLVVNPTPATLGIQSVWISGYNAVDGSDGDVTAQVLDNAGRDVATYSWVDVNDGEDVFYGWYDDNGDLVGNVSLAPGESFYVRAPDTSYYMNFPGVTL